MLKYFMFIAILCGSCLHSDDHFDHYRNLHLQCHVNQIDNLLEEYKMIIPKDFYEEMHLNICICQEMLNNYKIYDPT